MSLLKIDSLTVEFRSKHDRFLAIDGASLELGQGETLAIVGESGCGKTTLARCILGLQSFTGEITIDGEVVDGIRHRQAAKVGIVWQDPFASLDPRWKVKDIVNEPGLVTGKQINASEILNLVGLDESFLGRYPHQMSGGQRQRVAIARALALYPPFIICDEPTAALDLSIQAQVLNLLTDIQAKQNCSYLYISHDLGTVRYLAHRVAVMYLGRIVEIGATEDIFNFPRHPYTQSLLESVLSHERVGQLPSIELKEIGNRPSTGCLFAPRCPHAHEICRSERPALTGGFECHFPLNATAKNEVSG